MRRSIVFATNLFAPLAGLARGAEKAGFDRVWTTEFPDRDGLIRATVVGLATERIGVGTGIAYSFSRHPLALAAAALDVQEAIGGRFTLGLGTATDAMRSRWYGLEQDRPVARLADAVDLMRQAWTSTGRFRHDGPYFRGRVEGLDQAARSAALGAARDLRLGAQRGDAAGRRPPAATGWRCTPWPRPRSTPSARSAPILADANRTRDRPLPAAMWVITQIDDDPERARGRARRALAFFFSTPGYETAAAGEPWADAPERIRRRFAETRGDWDAVSAEVPDEMVDAMTLCGTPDEVRGRLAEVEARLGEVGVDEVVFQPGVELSEAEFVANCHRIIACCAPAGDTTASN